MSDKPKEEAVGVRMMEAAQSAGVTVAEVSSAIPPAVKSSEEGKELARLQRQLDAMPPFRRELELHTAWVDYTRDLSPDWQDDGVKFDNIDPESVRALQSIAATVLPRLGYQVQFGRTKSSLSIGVREN